MTSSNLVEEESEEIEEKLEELRIHIKMTGRFGDEREFLKYNDIEKALELLLEADMLGRWDGQEIDDGFYTVFFVGENFGSVFSKLEPDFKALLPSDSYIELEDIEGKVVTTKY